MKALHIVRTKDGIYQLIYASSADPEGAACAAPSFLGSEQGLRARLKVRGIADTEISRAIEVARVTGNAETRL